MVAAAPQQLPALQQQQQGLMGRLLLLLLLLPLPLPLLHHTWLHRHHVVAEQQARGVREGGPTTSSLHLHPLQLSSPQQLLPLRLAPLLKPQHSLARRPLWCQLMFLRPPWQ
ncbi:MAG: hypothetical protein MUC48_05985 [Leptolyngbya sp. Prado105]|nr:hypothetical protein [Leptolyngbya sp. Prado105]